MTDERTSTPATDTESTDPEAIIGLVTDGAHSLIVAQFPTMEDAEAAYQTLRDVEREQCSQDRWGRGRKL